MTKSDTRAEITAGHNARIEELGTGCYAFSADGCSNTGFIVGERGVLVIDGQATPDLAESVVQRIQDYTDKPVKLLVLTHYHADSTLGASAFGAGEIIASDLSRRMMDTRGTDDIKFSKARFPQLFENVKAKSAGILPSMTIASSMSIDLGGREVRLMHLGRGHTMGDLVVWVPESGVIYAGDLVQSKCAPYCGDAHLADWPRALDRIAAFRPNAMMTGRGRAVLGSNEVTKAIENTRDYVTSLRDAAAACVEANLSLKDTFQSVQDALAPAFGSYTDFETHLKFNVARAYDEALGLDQPQTWTSERWADLEDALAGHVAAGSEGVINPQLEEPMSEGTAEEIGETTEAVDETSNSSPGDENLDAELVEQGTLEDALGEERDVEPVAENGEPVEDLVSDSDFAASLLATPEMDGAPEEDVLDLSEDAIVNPGEKKVLEGAGI